MNAGGSGLYYARLLRRLGPVPLARASGRRMRAGLRNLVARPPELSTRSFLDAWGAESQAELVARALAPRPCWSDLSRRSSVLQALEAVPDGRARALERARRAAQRQFHLYGRMLCAGPRRPVPWGTDPVSGHRYPALPLEDAALLAPGSDPKRAWALGRLEGLIALGQGAWVAEPAEAAALSEEWVAQVTEFLRENPPGVGIQWSCAMEVALRGANLAMGLLMVRDAPAVRQPGFVLRVLQALVQHATFVEAHLEDGASVPNNHLIGDWLGLFAMASLFPELPGAAGWLRRSWWGLRRELLGQVEPEGCSFEGSVAYHRLVAEMGALAVILTRAAGVPLGSDCEERVRRMFLWPRAWCSDAGLAPQIGDNDSGRVLAVRDRPSLEHGYLAPFGAALFHAPELKDPQAAFPDEAAWLLGQEGREAFLRLEATDPPLGMSSPRGGLHVLRSPELVLTLAAGPQGQRGVGGHSHNDRCSFELHVRGRPIVVDPGSPSYTADPELRARFRSTAAHATLVVDGQEQSPLDSERPFALIDQSESELTAFYRGPTLGRISAAHQGFRGPRGPLRVERTVLFDPRLPGLTVDDRVEGRGAHHLSLRLPLAGEARTRPVQEPERELAQSLPGAPVRFSSTLVEVGPAGAPWALILLGDWADPALEASGYSPGYGEVQPAAALVAQAEAVLPARVGLAILFVDTERKGPCV